MLPFQDLYIGLIFGYGAAVPIGPINVEMVRRNLRFGVMAGLCFGVGAGLSDMTYLVLLLFGVISVLTHPTILHVVSFVGAIILAWFAFKAFRTKKDISGIEKAIRKQPLWRHTLDSYILTLLNPYTILFWSSVSAQVASYSHKSKASVYAIGGGVLLGVLSWVVILNLILFFTKDRLPARINQYLNYIGGTILLVFATISAWHAAY